MFGLRERRGEGGANGGFGGSCGFFFFLQNYLCQTVLFGARLIWFGMVWFLWGDERSRGEILGSLGVDICWNRARLRKGGGGNRNKGFRVVSVLLILGTCHFFGINRNYSHSRSRICSSSFPSRRHQSPAQIEGEMNEFLIPGKGSIENQATSLWNFYFRTLFWIVAETELELPIRGG